MHTKGKTKTKAKEPPGGAAWQPWQPWPWL